MRLFLIRHGDYIHEEMDLTQPLSVLGTKQIRVISRYLNRQSLQVGRLWSSPKKRALESAEILKAAVCPDIEIRQRDDLTPNADPRSVAEDLNSSSGDFIIVSHLPFIPALIQYLTKEERGSFKLLTGMAACLTREKEDLCWRVTELVSPDDVMD